MSGIVQITEAINRNIENYLLLENTDDGILSDVEQIICSNSVDEALDTPCVWIYEHPTTPYSEPNLSKTMQLSTPFEFVCIDYDDDPKIAQKKAKDLASRVCKSILKNKNTKENSDDPTRLFHRIDFITLYPSGEVAVEGKNKKVPAASLRLEFIYQIDWFKCCKKQ